VDNREPPSSPQWVFRPFEVFWFSEVHAGSITLEARHYADLTADRDDGRATLDLSCWTW
jgi:hypothetical protein